MINKETILSNYDDKLTLLKWIKNVEEALKNASAVSFSVNKTGDATLTFSIVFDDGSELTTDPIVLQQGESVESAAITNGHLILTLTNGDELDAGDVGAVSGFSINSSQHLIVTYQDGTTADLGAIFSGNITISGNLKVTGTSTLQAVSAASVSASGAVSAASVTATGAVSGSNTSAIDYLEYDSTDDVIDASKPVVETMSGYSFSAGSVSGLTITPIYAGAVKNGNKLTLAFSVNITKTATISSSDVIIGAFVFPSSIYENLYPVSIGSYSVLSTKKLLMSDTVFSGVELYSYLQKYTGNAVLLRIRSIDTLTADTTYYFRFEETFLLSDNLIS